MTAGSPGRAVRLLALAACLLAGGAADAREIDARFRKVLIEKIGKRLNSHAYAHGTDFGRWPEHVARHRDELDAAATEPELTAALNAVLGEFGLSHLWVWSPSEMETREAGRAGGYGLKTIEIDEGHLVTMVIRSGPADVAGVRKGDVITAVDGEPAPGARLGRGKLGGKRTLALSRSGTDTVQTVVTLGEYPRANPATLRWLDDGIAVIAVPSFSRSFYEKRPLYLEDVIEGFFDEAANAEGIVIDVRSNGGGYYLFPEHLAGMFMSAETDTYYVLHAEEHRRFLRRGGNPTASLLEMARSAGQVIRPMKVQGRTPYAGPVAVLVDGRTGSGGETFAASVQAAGRGPVIGTQTAGTVLSGNNARLPGGFELFYPGADFVMPDGTRIEGNGVEPDSVLDPRDTANDARVYRVAVEAIRSTGETAEPAP